MNLYTKRQKWKLVLLVTAVVIGVLTFVITNNLVKKLAAEERKKVELWAMGMRQLSGPTGENHDYSFILEVISGNETVPVILTQKDGEIISSLNLDPGRVNDKEYLQRQLKRMADDNEPIEIALLDGNVNYVYYKESILLNRLFYFPIIQFAVLVLFIGVSYFAFNISRKAEQNQVWVGMAKETAHQLGTPTSSLMASMELLRLKNVDEQIVAELEKDVQRLLLITDRFSKIGSSPRLENQDIVKVLVDLVQYIKARTSGKINFILGFSEKGPVFVPFNTSLFEWVIENVIKNAIDSMEGHGNVTIELKDKGHVLFIDISDVGKGIPKSKYKTIFQPGYTTKKRGWGLGLTLSGRIIETYHKGRIFVLHSELNKGTVMRIILHKQGE